MLGFSTSDTLISAFLIYHGCLVIAIAIFGMTRGAKGQPQMFGLEHLEERQILNARLPQKLLKRIRNYAEENNISQQAITEEALGITEKALDVWLKEKGA